MVVFAIISFRSGLNDKGSPDFTTCPLAMNAPDDTFKVKLSTKAKFPLDLGAANSGKFVVVYVRWYNDIKPRLSSKHSPAYLMRIP